jgi:hypothetical protein
MWKNGKRKCENGFGLEVVSGKAFCGTVGKDGARCLLIWATQISLASYFLHISIISVICCEAFPQWHCVV